MLISFVVLSFTVWNMHFYYTMLRNYKKNYQILIGFLKYLQSYTFYIALHEKGSISQHSPSAHSIAFTTQFLQLIKRQLSLLYKHNFK